MYVRVNGGKKEKEWDSFQESEKRADWVKRLWKKSSPTSPVTHRLAVSREGHCFNTSIEPAVREERRRGEKIVLDEQSDSD